MSVAIGADHAGYALKQELVASLLSEGQAVDDLGTHSPQPVDYPDVAEWVARAVLSGAPVGADRHRRAGPVPERLLPAGRAPGHLAGAREPWFVCTMWLARYRLRLAQIREDLAAGLKLLEWAARRALPSGTMAEQLHPYTGEPLSVSPLTWSHAEYVRKVQEYIDRFAGTNLCPGCGQALRTGLQV
jgi:hypothetical protein